jgi:hypothetical protein
MPGRLLNHVRNNFVGYIALFVAIGGTSYAAANLPANSVGTRQLRNHAVANSKLAKHAVAAANLDPKSIAGHIADWAQIRNGSVVSSSPRASVFTTDPTRGVVRVTWHRSIPLNCIAIANPTDVTPFGPASAHAFGPENPGRSADFAVMTFDGSGNNVPENFNIVVICP